MAQLGLQLVVSEAEILQLVSEREAFRQARDFAKSDAIRDQLRTMGVELYDKEREWRCRDGRRGFLFTAGPSMCTLQDPQIQERVNQREEARATKNWALADAYRDELRNQGVELDDKSRTWRTAAGRTGNYGGAGQVQQSSVYLSEVEIRAMVADRERARAIQDFATADELRRRLVAMGVEIYDKERIWKASDGRQGTVISGGVDPIQCNLSDADIVFRIALRDDARAQKDWPRADHIRDELRLLGVELIDSEQKWRTADGRTGYYTGDAAGVGGAYEYTDAQQQSDPQMQQWPATDESTSLHVLGDAASVSDPASAAELQRQWQVFNASLGTPPVKAMAQPASGQSAIPHMEPPSTPPPVQSWDQPSQFSMQQPQATQSWDQGYQTLGEQNVYESATGHQQQYEYGNAVGTSAAHNAATTASAGESSGACALSDYSIQALVTGREAVRENRNFEAADAIREDLKQLGVEIWDKQRNWKASDGRRGTVISADNQFQSKLALDIAQVAANNRGVGRAPAANAGGSMRSQDGSSAGLSTDLAAVMAIAGRIPSRH